MAGESGVASYVRTSKQRDGRTPDLSRDYTRSPEKPVEYTSPVIGYSVYLRERITSSNLHGETPWEGCWQTKLCWNCPCEICGWPLVVVTDSYIFVWLTAWLSADNRVGIQFIYLCYWRHAELVLEGLHGFRARLGFVLWVQDAGVLV